MTIKELLDMYDNWNGVTKINDCNSNCMAKDRTLIIAENDELTAKEVVSFGVYDDEFCIRIAEEGKDLIECYVGNYVAYKEFGKTKITHKANYEAVIRNENVVITFDGTIQEAVEYIKQFKSNGGNQTMTDIERIVQIAEELMAYQPLIDIPFEQFYQVAIALVDLGYVKKEVHYEIGV